MSLTSRGNKLLREHPQMLAAAHIATKPVRRTALPVLSGYGRGLRVRVGPSTLTRIVSRIEIEVEEAFLRALEPGDVVYDVGANIGWFALLAARRVGPAGKVFAFEPFAENVNYARSNAAANHFPNLRVVPAAVADRNGWSRFTTNSSLQGRLDEGGQDFVPVVSLDAWAESHDTPSLVKVDVEGAEGDVLRGMSSMLSSSRPILIIELHDTGVEVADLLDKAGYSHRPIDCPGYTRDAPWWAHILAIPR
jgi:FkbM family methyltransferase